MTNKNQITKIIKTTEEDLKVLTEKYGKIESNIEEVLFDEDLFGEDFLDESKFCHEPDIFNGEETIESNIIDSRCENNAVGTGSTLFGINKSGSTLNVKSGPSTNNSIIGKLGANENFVFIGTKQTISGYDWYWIEFLNASGIWTTGWYRGYSGVGYWKNNPYSSFTSKDMLGSNVPVKAYRIMNKTTVWSVNQLAHFIVEPGNLISCQDGFQGKTGNTKHTWMLCHGIRYNPGQGVREKDELFLNLDGGAFGSAGYIETNIQTDQQNHMLEAIGKI